jgi:hypothetical protein
MSQTHCAKCGHEPTTADKWRWSFYTAILFVILVQPYTFKLVQKLLGKFIRIADGTSGCPTMNGIFVHAAVFLVLVRYMMDLNI